MRAFLKTSIDSYVTTHGLRESFCSTFATAVLAHAEGLLAAVLMQPYATEVLLMRLDIIIRS